MYMNKKFIILLIILLPVYASCQNKADCKENICINELGICSVFEMSEDTVVHKNTENAYYRVFLKSCKGTLYVDKKLYQGNQLVFSGSYIETGELKTSKGIELSIVDGSEKEVIRQYYEPVKDGIWRYWNKDGQLIKEETYQKGKLLSKCEYFE